ncbi:MAG: cytochrome b/b6 domain-containing protein [Proteobacteria bacterium]|nr:cytochrome b/b6 domain-containing protein [Pseudomonadota bacterium]
MATPDNDVAAPAPREIVYRHRVVTRVTHWVNALCFTLLLMSGLQILNAHPALYWGQFGADNDTAFIEFFAARPDGRDGELKGFTRVGPVTFETTGLFGVSNDSDGDVRVIAMPGWATIPTNRDLATGRRWHFFFAWLFVINGAVAVGASVLNGHLRRDLLPEKRELRPRHILGDIWNHARLRLPKGDEAKRYNVLQKVSYLGVGLLLLMMIMTGLTMSPGINASAPWMLDLFGGRQSARTIHFLAASATVAFVVVHLAMVLLAGPINEIRSMITGRFVVPPENKS